MLNALVITGLWTLFNDTLPALKWWPRGVLGRVDMFVLCAAVFFIIWRLTRKLVYEPAGEGEGRR